MTKEQIKFFIDNQVSIFDEIGQRLESLGQEIELQDNDISVESVRNLYDAYYKHCSDIFDKYNMDYDAFKVIFAINNGDKSFNEQILGKNQSNQLLRDIIDIYGDEAYDVLGCNSYSFKMSDIDGILSGENNSKYEEFYTKLLNEKCENAYNLEQLSDILLSTKQEYINQGLIESFLKNPDRMILDSEIKDFIDTAPAAITSGSSVKLLVDRVESIISNASILEQIPPELFDEEFSKRLLEKSTYVFSDVFRLIPEESKNREIWEFAISKNNLLISSLPDKKIDENMTNEEYTKWCENLVIDVLRNNPNNIQDLFSTLRDSQKTSEVCSEGSRLLQTDDEYKVEEFLEKIPEIIRTRQIYEILLEKSELIIEHIPEVSFEEGLSQEEYNIWVDDIITNKISQRESTANLNSRIPRERMTEKVWNALLDKCNETNEDKHYFGLSSIPIQNITINMCERALKDISDNQIMYIPSVDRKLDTITNNTEREEYEKWLSGLSEEKKQSYKEWYESKAIDHIKKYHANLFSDIFNKNDFFIKIPPDAISINIINAYLQEIGPTGIEDIPIPSTSTNYNNQYEDIVISAISMLEEKNYLDNTGLDQTLVEKWDILEKIPEEYRTDKVVLKALKKHPKYLDYADFENENFNELLQIGYKNKLESIGRTELSEQEIKLIKKFAKNNSSLFSTLNLDIFNPDIINSIGENSLEKIVRYTDVQYSIIELAEDKDALTTFGFALENLKQDILFIEPLIEQLSNSIRKKEKYEVKTSGFVELASNRIQNKSLPLTEEEKTIISYLALNRQEANKIQSYDEILNFVANKNSELDKIINAKDSTLIDAKNSYLQRIVGMNYASVVNLVKKYGNDPEDLLSKYEGKELESYKEKAEKEALEIVIKLKSLIEEKDINKIKEAYFEAVEREDKTKSVERYKQATMLDNTLRRAYGRDITQTLSEHSKENNVESIEHTKDGQEYVLRKMNGPFNRMISVMNAYRKSDTEEKDDMYDRWNTSAMAGNHALCYSLINEENPGTALLGDKKGIIISISNFDAEAVTAAAPYDLCSDSRTNTTITYRPQKFYTINNLPNQTRGRYSEVDIEIQDVSENVTEYKKIQPTSIICFEEVDEDSIKASIALSKKLGRTIPIELIDRKELASQTRQEIDSLLNKFKTEEKLQPELIGQIITKYNNCRNAYMECSLGDDLVGEKIVENEIIITNKDAIFCRIHLNKMLSDFIEITKQRIEKGEIQEGLETIAQIKQFIREDREKNVLMPTMYKKLIMAGIDLDVDYSLNEIQRMYGIQEISTDTRNTTLEILQGHQELNSPTFETRYGKYTDIPEQLTFANFQENINFFEVKSTAEEIHQKGYYSENKSYSEEHITRVAMFSSVIANLEGADDKTKRLLQEAVIYHSSGRMLDIEEEQHQEYSSKIAGQELSEKYSETDVGIIQAAIELQSLRYSSYETDKMENERKEKVAELCEKYGLDISNGERIDCIAKYIEDSVNLDKTRFITKANNPPGEKFSFDSLKTDTARKLVKASYCVQDQLSTEHLKEMTKVANIDFEAATDTIMKDFFTRKTIHTEDRICDENIVKSPIVREAYLKHRFQEVDFESLIKSEEKISKQDLITEFPIASGCIEYAKKIAESRISRNVAKASQELKTTFIKMETQNKYKETEKEEI